MDWYVKKILILNTPNFIIIVFCQPSVTRLLEVLHSLKSTGLLTEERKMNIKFHEIRPAGTGFAENLDLKNLSFPPVLTKILLSFNHEEI